MFLSAVSTFPKKMTTRTLTMKTANYFSRELNTPSTATQNSVSLVSKSNSNVSEENATYKLEDMLLCKICYKENIRMVFLPCGHAIACAECAGTIGSCALCRDVFDVAMEVAICTAKGENEPSNGPLDPVLCKVCDINEMSTFFIPCNHIYACQKCAIGMRQCPACYQEIVSSKSVYL